MRRVGARLLTVLSFGCALAGGAAYAQSSPSVPRIGVLSPFSQPPADAAPEVLGRATFDALRQGLRDLGYRDGETIVIETRWAGGQAERLGELAVELVRMNVAVIVTVSMKGVRAARDATDRVPIVSAGAGDLVRGGLVASLAQPGGNITGVTDIAPELNGKNLEVLKELVPGLKRVAVLYYALADARTMELHLQDAAGAAQRLNLEIDFVKVRDADSLPQAFAQMKERKAQAMVTALSAFTLRYRAEIAELAAHHELPAIYQGREFTDAGGLMSYGTDRIDQWRRAARYVDQILKGAKPAQLPVQQPRRLELVVNLRAARALGLQVPPSMLIRADRIIE